MKSGGFHEIRMKSGGFHVKSGGFHEIHPKPCKIRRVFVETSDFMVKSARFHGEIHQISWISWNLLDFMVKSTGFHEICRISWWNLPDFMKSTGFHGFHEIHRISWISWMWAFAWWSSIGLSIERPINIPFQIYLTRTFIVKSCPN